MRIPGSARSIVAWVRASFSSTHTVCGLSALTTKPSTRSVSGSVMTLPAGLPSTSAPTSYLRMLRQDLAELLGLRIEAVDRHRVPPPAFEATISVLLSERKPSGTNAVPEVALVAPISFQGESALLR